MNADTNDWLGGDCIHVFILKKNPLTNPKCLGKIKGCSDVMLLLPIIKMTLLHIECAPYIALTMKIKGLSAATYGQTLKVRCGISFCIKCFEFTSFQSTKYFWIITLFIRRIVLWPTISIGEVILITRNRSRHLTCYKYEHRKQVLLYESNFWHELCFCQISFFQCRYTMPSCFCICNGINVTISIWHCGLDSVINYREANSEIDIFFHKCSTQRMRFFLSFLHAVF